MCTRMMQDGPPAAVLTTANMDTVPKIMYFPIRGRAEPTRLILALAGQKFENEVVAFADWPQVKATLPIDQMPIYKEVCVCVCWYCVLVLCLGGCGDDPLLCSCSVLLTFISLGLVWCVWVCVCVCVVCVCGVCVCVCGVCVCVWCVCVVCVCVCMHIGRPRNLSEQRHLPLLGPQ